MGIPLVSVLMTSFNREKYIAEAIESVLASSYSHFELIVSDDGSRDRTVEIVRSYAARDERVKLFVNDSNLGDYPNRNKAASYAAGKYLKYVDADDYIYPKGLEILVDMMEQFPEAGWGLCSLDQFVDRPFPFVLSPKEAYLFNYRGPGLFHKAPLSAIIKREVFEKVGGFNPIRMAGDFDMWNRLARYFPVVLMPHGIVWYREHGEQEVKYYRQFITTYESLKVGHLRNKDIPVDASTAKSLMNAERRRLMKNIVVSAIRLRTEALKDNIVRIRQYYV